MKLSQYCYPQENKIKLLLMFHYYHIAVINLAQPQKVTLPHRHAISCARKGIIALIICCIFPSLVFKTHVWRTKADKFRNR